MQSTPAIRPKHVIAQLDAAKVGVQVADSPRSMRHRSMQRRTSIWAALLVPARHSVITQFADIQAGK
jgi:hypothetical protein